MSYHVVKRHVTSVTNFELLHLLRQRGVRTPEEAAAAEEAAWAAQHRRQEPLREDVEVEDEGDAPPAAPAPGQPPPGGSGSQHPPPVYPRVNPPFAVEQAVFDHLMDSPAAAQDAEKLRHFLDLVANVELTKLEALQLMNSKPRTLVELHTLVEQVNTRLTEEEQEDLLQLCRTVL